MIGRRDIVVLTLLILLSFVLFLYGISVGAISIPIADVAASLLGKNTEISAWSLIIEERYLRTVNAFFAGGALAVVGMVLQSFFRNPLAGPGVLGISSGASLGVALAIMVPMAYVTGLIAQYLFGLLGSFLVILLLISINRYMKGITLLVVGLMLSFFTSAFVSMLLNSSTDTMMRKYIEWGFGSFGMIQLDYFWYYILAIFSLLLFIFIRFPKVLNTWVLGEQMLLEAGYKTTQIRLTILLVVGVLIALITVQCGPISFIGIAIPQLARMILKSTNHSILLPTTLFLGGSLAIIADIILRTTEISMPLNGILALFGAPVIIYVIVRGARRGMVS
jgi:iron complex transport system permease protein